MKGGLKQIRAQILWLTIGVNIGLIVIGSAILYLLIEAGNLDPAPATLLTILIASAIGLGFAFIQIRAITQPISMLLAAINHVQSQGSSDVAPPDPSKLRFGQNVVETIAGAIYTLASEVTLQTKQGLDSAKLHSIMDNMSAGLIVLSAHNEILLNNEAAQKIFATNAEPLKGKSFIETSHLSFQSDTTFAQWLSVCRTDKPTAEHFWSRVTHKKPEGDKKIFDMTAYYSKDDPNGIEVILVLVDRTEEYMVDEEQMDFVALAAHELRGPITVVRGYLDLYKQEYAQAASDEQTQLLERMTISSNQLSSYIHTILNVAKIEQGTMKIRPHPRAWAEHVAETTSDIVVRAKAMDKTIAFEIEPELPNVYIDGSAMGQVINNILDNAVKYSNEGQTITLKSYLKDDTVETIIVDKGIGIPESVVGNLFNKFYRSHRSRQGVSGTGLGLFLAKAIIEAHGGIIWVQSKEGEGSTFGFSVPIFTDALSEQLSKKGTDALIERKGHGWIKNHRKVIK